MVFVFLDNSNFLYGLHRHRKVSPLCVDVPFLKRLWTGEEAMVRGWVVGSGMDSPRRDQQYWHRWKAQGFTLLVSEKKQKEVFVDDALHAQMLYTILTETPQTMVLVSGDGNTNQGRTSFPLCVRLALQREWHVVVWAWREGAHLSWTELARLSAPRFRVRYLNDYVSRFVRIELFINFLHPHVVTEEDRLRKVCLQAQHYAHSVVYPPLHRQ